MLRWSNATCVTNDTTSPQDVCNTLCISCGELNTHTRPGGSSTVRGKAPAAAGLRVVFARGGYADGVNRRLTVRAECTYLYYYTDVNGLVLDQGISVLVQYTDEYIYPGVRISEYMQKYTERTALRV
jgi:hypothetical protein